MQPMEFAIGIKTKGIPTTLTTLYQYYMHFLNVDTSSFDIMHRKSILQGGALNSLNKPLFGGLPTDYKGEFVLAILTLSIPLHCFPFFNVLNCSEQFQNIQKVLFECS